MLVGKGLLGEDKLLDDGVKSRFFPELPYPNWTAACVVWLAGSVAKFSHGQEEAISAGVHAAWLAWIANGQLSPSCPFPNICAVSIPSKAAAPD